ncbi:hypothetical protein AVEN_143307-1 [Araneus ventricosus]|uniref:Uncharacterized protein n=1 Tax=Araneus ventricosus TaxID=182803 RepID=A0A4Y2AEF5_ARAVE|nr:hypothetical protein AVEN_143307-1 [Araneus ventricosus]
MVTRDFSEECMDWCMGSCDKKENGETPYGLPPAYAAFGPVVQENLLQPLTSLSDRTVNLEAMLLGFLRKNL